MIGDPDVFRKDDLVWIVPAQGGQTVPVRIDRQPVELPGFMRVRMIRPRIPGTGAAMSEVEIQDGPHRGQLAVVETSLVRLSK